MEGVKFDYNIVRDFAKELGWGALETLVVIRQITARVKAD